MAHCTTGTSTRVRDGEGERVDARRTWRRQVERFQQKLKRPRGQVGDNTRENGRKLKGLDGKINTVFKTKKREKRWWWTVEDENEVKWLKQLCRIYPVTADSQMIQANILIYLEVLNCYWILLSNRRWRCKHTSKTGHADQCELAQILA